MFYSEKYNLLFIACPKTGSTSIELYLSKLDPKGERSSLSFPQKKITGKDMHGRGGHAKAWEIKEAIGEQRYSELKVFGFVRDPIEKLISTYNYNKESKLSQSLFKNGKVKIRINTIKQFLTITLAKCLPFRIWAIIFPMKTCHEYFYDNRNNRIVPFLGRTDQLNHDMTKILENFGILSKTKVPHINKSSHKNKEEYLKKGILRTILEKRYEKDVLLYEKVGNEMRELKKSI